MQIDAELIERLSILARIRLDESQNQALQQDIDAILHLVDQLQQVDTAGVEPMSHPLEIAQPVRTDQVTETDQRQSFQPLAPATESGMYLVPRVVE